MKFKELDSKLRLYETNHDHCVLPGLYIVARLDGRNFTRLTKEICEFEAPFDIRFRDYMIRVTRHLMQCGFNIIYGYTQSDEISLLFKKDENTFNRKTRKINSILAGEASAELTQILKTDPAITPSAFIRGVFDCRVCQFPSVELVIDYFRWRSEDAHRNCLNSHCHWALINNGYSPKKADSSLKNLSNSDKNELLYKVASIKFNNLPLWQKRGVGIYWEAYQKEGFNPVTKNKVLTEKKLLKTILDLPMKADYDEMLFNLIKDN